jgi:exosortase A
MSAVLTPTVSASAWRPASLVLSAAFALLLTLYWDTAASMVSIWYRSETFAHAFLVPPISAWLIWRQRQELAALTPRPEPWLLLPLFAAAMLWMAADLVLVNAASHLAFVALIVLLVPAFLGLHVAWTILFPLLFLFFAVPIGEFMTQPMMDWTADFTVATLRLSGIPVYREGLQFVIPSGSWSVVEACSGVRYLIASFMVGTLFAYLNFTSWKRRLAFMLVSIAVPIVANWLRAYGIVMLGHLSGNTIAVGVDHLIYGWVFFGIVVTAMFLIGARWSDPVAEAAPAGGPGRWADRVRPAGATMLTSGLLAAAAVLAIPHAAIWGLERSERSAAAPVLAMSASPTSTWQLLPEAASDAQAFRPRLVAPAATQHRAYEGSDGRVDVVLAYYRGQSDESKLVSSVNVLVQAEDSRWNHVSTESERAQAGATPVTFRSAYILGNASAMLSREHLTVWRVYWIDGRWVAGDVRAKIVSAWARVRGRGDDGAILVLWTDDPDRARARLRLQAFVADNLGAIGSSLAETRNAR